MSADVRWKQRYVNFDKACSLLIEGLRPGAASLNLLEKEGVIQRFEYSFELAWKAIKDYLEESGLVISPLTPRQVLKDAFAARIIPDGQIWIDMLDHRNLLSHTYDTVVFEDAVAAIETKYLGALQTLRDFFKLEAVK